MNPPCNRGWTIQHQSLAGASRPALFLVSCLLLLASLPVHAIVDVNNNSVSDLWEKRYNDGQRFTNFDPLADPDGDGWSNELEAAAGTDPFDADPPNGYLQPKITCYPVVYQTDPDTNITQTASPAVVSLGWPTLPGKQYTLLYSTDLAPGSWSPLEVPRIGTGGYMGNGITLTQQDGSMADRIFWRVAVTDPIPAIDSDGDNLSNYEEYLAGSDPIISDSDGDTLSDYAELIAGTNPNNADEDGDGWTDPQEIAASTDSRNQDTDGDGIPDSLDIKPLLSIQIFADTDDDGIPDENDANPNDPRGVKPVIVSENASGNPQCEVAMDETSTFVLTVSNPAGPSPTPSDFTLYLNGSSEPADINALPTPPSAADTQRFLLSWDAKVTTGYPAQTLQNISLRFRDAQNATTWLNLARVDVAEWEGMVAGLRMSQNTGSDPSYLIRSHYAGKPVAPQQLLGPGTSGARGLWYRGPRAIALLNKNGGDSGVSAAIPASTRYPLLIFPESPGTPQLLDVSSPDTYPDNGTWYKNWTDMTISVEVPAPADVSAGEQEFVPLPTTDPRNDFNQIFFEASYTDSTVDPPIKKRIETVLHYIAGYTQRRMYMIGFQHAPPSISFGSTNNVVSVGPTNLELPVGATINPHSAGTLEYPGVPIGSPNFPPAPYQSYASGAPLLPIQSEQWHKLVLKVGPDAGAVSNGIILKLGTGEEGENAPQSGFSLQMKNSNSFTPLTIPGNGEIEMLPSSDLYQKLTSLGGLTLFLKRDATVSEFHRMGLDLVPKRSTDLIQRVAALDVRPIDFVNKDKAVVAGLKVGKMEDSLSAAGALDINLDEDRFYVRLPGAAALRNVSIKLATIGNPVATYNDDPTEIDLEVDGNDLVTKSLLLVSDDIDDDHAGNGVGADDQNNDRTHKVQLGGKVRVESIRIDGTDYPVDAKIPVPVRKKLSGRIILVGAASARSLEVLQLRDIARERYAQAGVIFDLHITTMEFPQGVLPNEVNFDGGVAASGGAGGNLVHEDIKKLVEKADLEGKRGTVTVFVVPNMTGLELGRAFTKAFTAPVDQARANTAVLSAADMFNPTGTYRYTLAHEVGHLLTNHGHFGEEYGAMPQFKVAHNLMRGGGTSSTDTLTSSKRIYQLQEDMFLDELLVEP